MIKLLLGLALSTVDAIRDVRVEDGLFRDRNGRHVILHGVNAVYKVAPYMPDLEHEDPQLGFTDADVDDLLAWGINHVRLGVMWEAVEREPGVYNQTYLDEIEVLINRLGKAGISVLVDAHQDVLARQTCGEGMPTFYAQQVIDAGTHCIGPHYDWILAPIAEALGACRSIDAYGFRKDANGLPLLEDCQTEEFSSFYLTRESISLFRAIYFNEHGMRDNFINFWQAVAEKFHDNEHVMGFDPLNEPFPAWNDPITFVL
jgi:endoglycosylceramidase